MALSTIGTAGIADDAITSAKVDSTTTAFTVADLVATNSITAGTELIGNISGRILLDASAAGTRTAPAALWPPGALMKVKASPCP